METRKPGRPKGQPKSGGRQKGTPNKISGSLREMILGALDDAGGQAYLSAQAEKNPAAFMTLVGKVLPMQVDANIGGKLIVSWEK